VNPLAEGAVSKILECCHSQGTAVKVPVVDLGLAATGSDAYGGPRLVCHLPITVLRSWLWRQQHSRQADRVLAQREAEDRVDQHVAAFAVKRTCPGCSTAPTMNEPSGPTWRQPLAQRPRDSATRPGCPGLPCPEGLADRLEAQQTKACTGYLGRPTHRQEAQMTIPVDR